MDESERFASLSVEELLEPLPMPRFGTELRGLEEFTAYQTSFRKGLEDGRGFFTQTLYASERKSQYDQLTGLLNRHGLEVTIEALKPFTVPGQTAVLYIDLDNFKNVNDSLGHDKGDQTLVGIFKKIEEITRHNEKSDEQDVLIPARLGGDEAALFLLLSLKQRRVLFWGRRSKQLNAARSMENAVDRIKHAGHNYIAEDPELVEAGLDLSIGVALISEGQTVNEALAQAEENMYKDKIDQLPDLSLRQRIQFRLGSFLLNQAGVPPRMADKYRRKYSGRL